MEKLCVIRIRSSLKKSGDIGKVIKNLDIRKLYSCTLLDNSPSNLGMIKKADSVLTYGEINNEMLEKLLLKRARLSNRKKFEWQDAQLKEAAQSILSGKSGLEDMKIKRVFNLHPPIKGFERRGKKMPYTSKGVFGYRGADINSLLDRMI